MKACPTTDFFMNTECNRIAYALASALDGNAWYGDPLRKIMDNITAPQAQARPIANAHSIWELVVHVEAWVKFCLGAVQGTPIPAWSTPPRNHSTGPDVQLLSPVSGHDPACDLSRRADCVVEEGGFSIIAVSEKSPHSTAG